MSDEAILNQIRQQDKEVLQFLETIIKPSDLTPKKPVKP
jgi:hypothetical protein